ncbi:uncharacterized protein LOC116207942 [Punica granatum]|uniref:VQ domain-containing protein n=2 Tax=Punica granatum TaxID=22663 RepID=A0A218XBK3_PUNGR|nr:uncharacterized protein LOC116207942 [Punica granatum]OWM82086.1 hypothetical protein CDL15_Pgr001660 [Punica granatum]PKI44858.1 hypothetical protein CRG98_034806 [Punica granatum]
MEVYPLNSSGSPTSSGKSARKDGKRLKKPPCKPFRNSSPRAWKNKLPVAPPPPTPTRVYKVESDKFKEVVQMLTGAGPESLQTPQELVERNPPPAPIITLDVLEACRYRVYYQENSLNEYPFPWKPNQDPLAEPDLIRALCTSSSSSSPSGWWSSVPLLSPGSLPSLESGALL